MSSPDDSDGNNEILVTIDAESESEGESSEEEKEFNENLDTIYENMKIATRNENLSEIATASL